MTAYRPISVLPTGAFAVVNADVTDPSQCRPIIDLVNRITRAQLGTVADGIPNIVAEVGFYRVAVG